MYKHTRKQDNINVTLFFHVSIFFRLKVTSINRIFKFEAGLFILFARLAFQNMFMLMRISLCYYSFIYHEFVYKSHVWCSFTCSLYNIELIICLFSSFFSTFITSSSYLNQVLVWQYNVPR